MDAKLLQDDVAAEMNEPVAAVPTQRNHFAAISTEVTPSIAKQQARDVIKKLELNPEDVNAAEELHMICLFCTNFLAIHLFFSDKNRQAIVEGGIMPSIILSFKTKAIPVQVVIGRTLQLFAQDGGLKMLHCLTILQKKVA